MKIFVTKMENCIPEDIYLEKIRFLSMDRQAKIKRFVNNKDKYRSILSELLLRFAFIDFNLPVTSVIKLVRNNLGKPIIYDSDYFFNLSHSGIYVVLAFGLSNAGIDVEEIKEIDPDISKMFLSNNEIRSFELFNLNEKKSYFYEMWTVKESFSKLIGRGLSMPLNEIEPQFLNDKLYLIDYKNKCYISKIYDFNEHYNLSLSVLSENELPKILTSVNTIDLLQSNEILKFKIEYY